MKRSRPWGTGRLALVASVAVGIGCSSSNETRTPAVSQGGSAGSGVTGGNGGAPGNGGASGNVGGSGATSGTAGTAGTGAGAGTAGSAGQTVTDGSPGTDVDFDACGGQKVTATSKPVNILLVIDKSGSMADKPAGFTVDKWTALKTALNESLNQVKGGIAFGLELFPVGPDPLTPIEPTCKTNCCDMQVGSVDIGITRGTVALPAILGILDTTVPAGGTPTAVALNNALGYFTAGPGKDLPGEKYVLLATDGAPNCNGTAKCDMAHCTLNIESSSQCMPDGGANCCANPGMGPACLDDTSTVDQIGKLKAAGVSTFVVGIPGTELYASFLDSFAVAGGMTAQAVADAAAAGPKYFAVSASGGVGALTEVFKSITTLLIKSCDLQLATVPPDVNLLNVKVNGKIIAKAGDDGWDVDQTTTPPTIRIKGTTCQDIETNGAQSVEVIYGCPTIIIY
jgi:hypothetical protein